MNSNTVGTRDVAGHDMDVEQASLNYLLVEFECSVRHLGGLEDKRLRLFLGYCVVSSLLLLSVVVLKSPGLAGGVGGLPLLVLLGLWFSALSWACRHIALSERSATERYRNKINLLRKTILDTVKASRLHAMQAEGNHFGLQITSNPTKHLQVIDLLSRERWTTALFMKLVYDLGVVLGFALASLAIV